MQRTLLGATLSLVLLSSPLVAQAHVHGEAELDIGIDGKSVTMELRVPGDDMYGFEHEPRTVAERTKRDAAVANLKARATTLVQFDHAFACRTTPGAVTFTAGPHVEVHARYDVTCQKAPIGRDIRFGVSTVFPALSVVRVQVVSDAGQSAARIVANRGSVRP